MSESVSKKDDDQLLTKEHEKAITKTAMPMAKQAGGEAGAAAANAIAPGSELIGKEIGERLAEKIVPVMVKAANTMGTQALEKLSELAEPKPAAPKMAPAPDAAPTYKSPTPGG